MFTTAEALERTQEEHSEWKGCRSYNPNEYSLAPLLEEDHIPDRGIIEIALRESKDGSYIQYQLSGIERNKITGIIEKKDIIGMVNVDFPANNKDILGPENYKKWLSIILQITRESGQTPADNKPPKVAHGPYAPYSHPKGELEFDKARQLWFYRDPPSQPTNHATGPKLSSLCRFSIFVTTAAAVAVGVAIASQKFRLN